MASAYQRKYAYGISKEAYDLMLTNQAGRCAICCKDARLVIDHNHVSGKVRSLLCYRCNLLVGVIEKNSDLLKQVSSYLQSHA